MCHHSSLATGEDYSSSSGSIVKKVNLLLEYFCAQHTMFRPVMLGFFRCYDHWLKCILGHGAMTHLKSVINGTSNPPPPFLFREGCSTLSRTGSLTPHLNQRASTSRIVTSNSAESDAVLLLLI